MADKNSITQDYLRSILHYDPQAGIFTRLPRQDRQQCWNTRYAGKNAGAMLTNGYVCIGIDGKTYLAHRMAFIYMTGSAPDCDIDHIDGDRTNNRWCNLRPATRSENMINSDLKLHNKSGFKGVSWHKGGNKWRSTIKLNGKQKHLGFFDTPERAYAAYCDASRLYHGEFSRHT